MKKIPKWSRQAIDLAMTYYSKLAAFISRLSYSNLMLARTLEDRIKAQNVANAGEIRLSQLAYQARIVTWEVNNDGLFTYVSDVSTLIVGYSPQELIGKKYFYDLHPDEGREVFKRAAFGIFGQKKEFRNLVNCIRHKDGSLVWVSTNGIPVVDDEDRLLGYRGSDTDITIQKLAEDKLKDSEKLFRNFFELPLVGAVITSPEGRWLAVNERFCEITGYSKAELKLLDWQNLTPKSELDAEWSAYEKIVTGLSDKYDLDKHYIRKDGSLVDVHLSTICVRKDDGTPDYFASFVQDITDRKNAELLLRESQQRLALAASSAGLGIWDWDLTNNRMTWDTRMFGLYGVSEEPEQYGVEIWEKALHPEDKAATWKACQDALDGKKEYDVEFRIIRPDGDIRWMHGNGIVIRDADGKAIRMLGINADITDRRGLEERLRQIEKMRAVEQLAGGIAHDFNNQLAGMMGFAEIIKRNADDTKLVEYSEKILSSGRRASELVKRLLAFSRKGRYLNQPVSLGDIVREVVDILGRTVSKDIEITTSLDAAGDVVIGDKTQIQNAILNLAINARDAMPSGGVMSFVSGTMLADEKYCKSQPFEMTPGKYVLISVCDTGCGVPPENLQRIFEPFFTTKGEGQGTGLGLSSVYGTVKNHGGAITVKSQVGKGSVFTIYLPQSPLAARAEIVRQGELRKTRKLTVMVVDDEAIVGEMACGFLGELGHEAKLFSRGADAIDYYAKNFADIDLAILDMAMPKMDGRHLFLEMRRINPSAKVMIATGYSITSEINKLMEEGVVGLLQKPYSLDQIASAIAGSVKK